MTACSDHAHLHIQPSGKFIIDDKYTERYVSTIGMELRTMKREAKLIKLHIWGTAGQERFSFRTSTDRDAHSITIVDDASDKEAEESSTDDVVFNLDAADGDEGTARAGKQSRSVKKNNDLFVIRKPDVHKSVNSDAYVVYGKAETEDLGAQARAQCRAFRATWRLDRWFEQ